MTLTRGAFWGIEGREMCRKKMKEALILSAMLLLKYRSRRKKIKQNLVIPKYQYI